MRSMYIMVGCALVFALFGRPAAGSDHDIHFLSEHVPESAMDAHYLSLPWPAGRLERGAWQPSVDFSIASTSTEFIDIDGPMIAFAAGRGVTRTSGFEVLGFYSNMDVSGSGGLSSLSPSFFHDVPLDLPAEADFTNPRGTLRHFGVGAAYVRERGRANHSAQVIWGGLLERAELSGFQLDYRLVSGADAGATGLLDHSSSATFISPFVGWQQTRTIGTSWSWSPRALIVHPLPPGDLDARLTGPGFDLATPGDGDPLEFGDPFITLSLAFAHLPSGFELDLGGTLFFRAAEHVSHAAVDRAFVVHLAWRGNRARHAAD
jgi:hypothetical protein